MIPRILAAFAALAMAFWPAAVQAQEPVDLELVLAVDISRSMDFEEQLLQRQGYAEAFRSRDVIDAITGGGYGRIAVAYVEWAGVGTERVVVPWTLIDSAEASLRFAASLEGQQPQRLSRTSISNALAVSGGLLGGSGYRPLRQVIDVSGDGPNNQGVPVQSARDALVQRGVVVNGLPLMVRTGGYGFAGIDKLDEYYFDCVIGGPGAFVLPVYSWKEFPEAVRRKLVLEISGFDARPTPVAAESGGLDDPARPRSDCLIGEKLWEMRMRDLEWR